MISAITSAEQGCGLYSFGEVARYLHLPVSTLRSWFISRGAIGPLIHGEIDPSEQWLSFRDFTDAYVAAYLKSKGVKPRALREGLLLCKQDHHLDHPLSMKGTQFSVDRATGQILVLPPGYPHHVTMTGPSRNQIVLDPVMDEYMSKLEFDDANLANRYIVWKQKIGGKIKRVVMEPGSNFGEPTVENTPYRAITLRDAAEAEGGPEKAAELYEVEEGDVIIAIEAFNHAPELQMAA
jgi:uncharacterized protein (DUF433 family)